MITRLNNQNNKQSPAGVLNSFSRVVVCAGGLFYEAIKMKIQKTINIAGKPCTAKKIIASQIGQSKNGMRNSRIDNTIVLWQPRTEYNNQGYLDSRYHRVCKLEDADTITIENFDGIIATLTI